VEELPCYDLLPGPGLTYDQYRLVVRCGKLDWTAISQLPKAIRERFIEVKKQIRGSIWPLRLRVYHSPGRGIVPATVLVKMLAYRVRAWYSLVSVARYGDYHDGRPEVRHALAKTKVERCTSVVAVNPLQA
jgi:hypothetical protein